MTVKEEKILLLAQESKSIKEMARAAVKIIKNCFDIKAPEKLAIADVEKAFLELRAKSIGEKLNFSIKTDNGKIPIEMDITTFEVEEKSNKSHKMKINDEMILVLKDPEFNYLCEIDENESDIMKNIFKYCFVELQTKTNVYVKDDISDKDLEDFYDYMTSDQVDQFYTFVKNIPRLKKTVQYSDNTGEKKTITLMGIDSFFV